MKQALLMEPNAKNEIEAQKLVMAKRLLDLLNAHVMSDEGVHRTSFQNRSKN